jgi:hypothetical protein
VRFDDPHGVEAEGELPLFRDTEHLMRGFLTIEGNDEPRRSSRLTSLCVATSRERKWRTSLSRASAPLPEYLVQVASAQQIFLPRIFRSAAGGFLTTSVPDFREGRHSHAGAETGWDACQ